MNKTELVEFTAKEKIYKIRLGKQGEFIHDKNNNNVLKCDEGKEFVVEDAKENFKLKGIRELCDEYYIDNVTAGKLMKGETVFIQSRPVPIKVVLFDVKTANQKNTIIKISEENNILLNNIKGERLAFKMKNNKLFSPFVITEKQLMLDYDITDNNYKDISIKHNKNKQENKLPKHANKKSLEMYYSEENIL